MQAQVDLHLTFDIIIIILTLCFKKISVIGHWHGSGAMNTLMPAIENYPLRHLLDVTETEIHSRDVEIAISGIKQIRRKYGD